MNWSIFFTLAATTALALTCLLAPFSLRSSAPQPSRGIAFSQIFLLILALLCAISAPEPALHTRHLELLAALAVLAAALGGGAPASYFMKSLEKSHIQGPKEPAHARGKIGPFAFTAQISKAQDGDGAAGGGQLIGIFERAAVATLLLAGQPGLLAVVVAIKGLARYPEIKAGHLTAEKFIVGTCVSLLWAAGCVLTVMLLG